MCPMTNRQRLLARRGPAAFCAGLLLPERRDRIDERDLHAPSNCGAALQLNAEPRTGATLNMQLNSRGRSATGNLISSRPVIGSFALGHAVRGHQTAFRNLPHSCCSSGWLDICPPSGSGGRATESGRVFLGVIVDPRQAAQIQAVAGSGDGDVGQAGFTVVDGAGH